MLILKAPGTIFCRKTRYSIYMRNTIFKMISVTRSFHLGEEAYNFSFALKVMLLLFLSLSRILNMIAIVTAGRWSGTVANATIYHLKSVLLIILLEI